MKLMIASDIHGSAYYCRKMLEAYDREEAEGTFSTTAPATICRRITRPRRSSPC